MHPCKIFELQKKYFKCDRLKKLKFKQIQMYICTVKDAYNEVPETDDFTSL